MPSLLDQFSGVPPVGITPGMDNTQQPMPYVNQQQPDLVSNGAPLSWQQRVMAYLRNPSVLASQVGNGITASMMPNTDGLNGLLSDSDKQHARTMALMHAGAALSAAGSKHVGTPAPSLMQAISSGLSAGQEGAQQDIGASLQNKMTGLNTAQQLHILASRQAIGRMFAPKPDDTPQQVASRLAQAYSAYASVGDTEMMGKLADVIKEMPQFKSQNLSTINLGDKEMIWNPATGQSYGSLPRGAAPMSDDAKAFREVGIADARARSGDAAQQRVTSNTNAVLDDFARDTKDFQKAKSGYDVLRAAEDNPNMAQPFAMLDAYARVANPGAIVRPSTLEILNSMGSLGQRIEKFMQHNINGTLPPEMVKAIGTMVNGMMRNHREQYRLVRQAALRRASGAGITNIEDQLPDYDVALPGDATPTKTRQNPLLQP